MTTLTTNGELLAENERLRLRLEEAEAVVEAIRNGLVDAVVVNSTPGESVYTLEGADRPYRLLVETMQQGVALLNPEGVILYCNRCVADLFRMSVEKVIGGTLDGLLAGADHAVWTDLLRNDLWTAPRAVWASACAWCNGWWKCTEAGWRLIVPWVKGASLSCVCR